MSKAKSIATYHHRPDPPAQEPDTRPGDYFVSVFDRQSNAGHGRHALAAGPYTTHRAALDAVADVRRLAEGCDVRAVWYAFGTCRLPVGSGRVGVLNKRGLL